MKSNNKDCRVSVIIPAYNAELSLARCIKSVLAQTLPSFEIIVINDGSSDKTIAVAKGFSENVAVLSQQNQGQGAARNTGLRNASGDYVAFLDADDYWLPDFLQNCIGFLDNNPQAVAVNTSFKIKKKGGDYTGPTCRQTFAMDHPDGSILENFYTFWAKYDHIRTGTALIRMDVIKTAGYQREDLRISQDLEYWGYIATFGPWGFIPKVLWVGDSASIATKTGWRKKYELRRRLCPDVETWEERIVPRLKRSEIAGFEIVRGRVAAGFAHNKVLAGKTRSAFAIFKKYGHNMPKNRVTKLLYWGDKLGFLGRRIVASILKIREFAKG